MPTALVLAGLVLAVYRAARFLTHDTLTQEWRQRLFDWAWEEPTDPETGVKLPPVPRASWRSYVWGLLSCPLCLGVWISAVFYVAWVNWSWSHPPLVILAIAGGQCFVQMREDPK